MAEKEGFEPSKPFWGLHDFQSCALGQLRDFSIPFLSSSVATDWDIILQSSQIVNSFFKIFKNFLEPKTPVKWLLSPLDPAATARSPSTVPGTACWFIAHHYGTVPTSRRDAFPVPWIFPRPKKVSTGHFLTFAALRPAFQIRLTSKKEHPSEWMGVLFGGEGGI